MGSREIHLILRALFIIMHILVRNCISDRREKDFFEGKIENWKQDLDNYSETEE